MSNYYYQALNKADNKLVKGTIEANSLRDARQKICNMGLLPTDINLYAHNSSYDDYCDPKSISLSLKTRILFISEIQLMISSGLSIFDALETFSSRNIKDLNLKKFVIYIQKSIANGSTLHEALVPFSHTLGNVIIGLCKAGEASGKLQETLLRAKMILIKEEKIRSKIIKMSIYPAVLIFVVLALVFFMGLYGFPKLMSLIPLKEDKTPLADLLIAFPRFCVDYWFIIIIFISALIGIFMLLFSDYKFRKFVDQKLLEVPLLSDFVKYINLANFFAILSESYESDVPVPEALVYASSSIKNIPIRERAELMDDMVAKGYNITQTIVTFDYVDDSFLTMIEAGEKSGQLGQAFKDITEQIDEKIDSVMEVLLQLYDPAIKIIVGIVVVIFAVGFMQMYFSLLFSI